jgi:hypothetical protein
MVRKSDDERELIKLYQQLAKVCGAASLIYLRTHIMG